MSRQIENSVRAALAARAEQIDHDRLRPAEPPPPRERPKWALPLAVAAAVTLALAVPSAGAVQRLTADPEPVQPGVSSTVPEPSPTSASPTASSPPAPSVTSTQPSGSAAGATKVVSYQGMTMSIPFHWVLEEVPADPGFACLREDRTQTDSTDLAANCELTITTANAAVMHSLHADEPRQVASQLHVCDENPAVRKLDATTVDIGGRAAQYRRYGLTCPGVSTEIEQWTFPTRPAAKFHRKTIRPETEQAVRAAVASARFDQPETNQPVSEFGFIVGYERVAGGVRLTVDRAVPVWRGPFDWGAENNSDATYRYDVAAEFFGVDDRAPGLCGSPPQPRVCGLDELLRRIDEGTARPDGGVPIREISVWLGMDGQGRVASIR
jgi:hypothetical protein